MTLTTNEELKHLASSDNTNELTRRLARECLANRKVQPFGYVYTSKDGVAVNFGHELPFMPEKWNVTPVYTAPPAPAVPDEATSENVEALSGYVSTYKMTESERDIAAEVWNACRAAMLAQPLSSGYKLVPAEPTEDMIAAAMNCDDVSFNADETFCVNFGNIYAAMVAAVPEGGNDHDTRR
ncbi:MULTISPECIES: hypothetical protein [unclassified Serratia]|uniref:hypothetical protein n=1 Tax=unclassified Serratia (in: enterobacteria) TaxID=2647522 RepID=UPI0015F5EDBD